MSAKHRCTRRSSDAENIGLKPKPYRKLNKLTSSATLRDSSVRRRNRVISGLSVPKFILNNAKRQQTTVPSGAVKPDAPLSFTLNFTLPTPPASPICKPVDIKDKITFSFPRHLERPAFPSVTEESLRECDPEGLKGVPIAYIRRSLAQLGPHMFQVLAGIRAPPFKSDLGLPKEVVVLAHDLSAQMPTHLLAVFARPAGGSSAANRANVTLYPAHHIVLAAHCTNLPKLGLSAPPPPQQRGGPVVLPTVSMILPHPQSYHAIHQYFYIKDRVRLLASFLPAAPPQGVADGSATVTEQFARHLAATFTAPRLLHQLRYVHGAYRNMCKLGVEDEVMWQLLNIAWEVLLNALAVNARTPVSLAMN